MTFADFAFWVPIDDELYLALYSEHAQDSRSTTRSARLCAVGSTPTTGAVRNLHNDYLIDRGLQRTRLYSGIEAVNPAEQDGCATETMGPIYDRIREHLGYSDKTIIALRKMLLNAVRELAKGKEPPHVIQIRERDRDFFALAFAQRVSAGGTPTGARSWKGLGDE